MARKKKPEAPANTEGWLNTYADMVTLLLCFFVMMYTASTPDEAKMQWVLRSISNLTGEIVNPVVVEDPSPNSVNDDEGNPGPDLATPSEGDIPGVPGNMPMTYNDLFNWVSTAIQANNLSESVSAEMVDGKLHIRFDSDIMFAADSYELLAKGREALNTISPGIKAVNDYIESVQIAGHTAPLLNGSTGGINDWFLSGMRSVSVVNHLDFGRRMVDSEKFITSGFGKYDPYYPIDSEETNAKNRRVELVITRNEYKPEDTPFMIDLLKHDYKIGPIPGTRKPSPAALDREQQIIERIREKFGDSGESVDPVEPINEFGPSIPRVPTISADGSVLGIDDDS